ncbi:ABC transporter permease [Paracoccus kondratievae]|uniref:ABC transporter permease n=1 Tax=Paracoccus kondratievae TaxID=135740 RepID=UPI0012663483|nr:ABC transporter permease [Paracoccus kondratievae]QFQ86679.1 ABC transporter permease [Paracoccus kondratievae]
MSSLTGTDMPQRLSLAASLRGLPHAAPLAVIAGLCLAGAMINPGFLTQGNIVGVLAAAAMLALASAGQTLVILSGNQGYDLSVGSVMTISALLVSGIAGASDAALPQAALLALAVGALVGLLNGLGVHFLKLYPLIVTLGVSFAVEGIGLVYAQTRAPSLPGSVLETLGVGSIMGLPWVVVMALLVALGLTLMLRRSRFGQMLYMVGANTRAARAAGVPVARILIGTYLLSGLLSAFAGILLYGFAGSVNLSLGAPYTMMSVTAVVIGGASLAGGRGSYIGTCLGALIFAVLTNLLISFGFGVALRYVVSGLVLLVVLSVTSREKF